MTQDLSTCRPSGLPPIWVLNLPRSVDRRARMTSHLAELGIKFEFVEAIEGKNLSPEECARLSDAKKAHQFLGRHITPPEIACSLSHRMLYQKQLDEGFDEVVILEDDAVVDPAFLEVINLRSALPKDWDVVYFYRGNTRVSYWGSRPLGRWRCVKFGSMAYGAVGYMVRSSGARKLLAHNNPVSLPADCLTGGAIRTGVKLYGIDPPCIRELTRAAAASTMPELNAMWQNRPKGEKKHWLIRYLERQKKRLKTLNERFNPFSIF